ncbi:group-specific protein [Mesobacillus maritimus]|uniref:group-specific protein n=1 Tax=Mesobacillus maritimus TaxID=1643336 RepID=UPI0020410265|nr:group-specific protein [Mesobacillus maritimus]MCM3585995.1 group-specific protein [Mesobacillus maritimus]MCM3670344.1 group-specific protein [Mesobacillus maritimus]
MGECKIDHSYEDVRKKYEEQAPFLKEKVKPLFDSFFKEEHTQDILNEVFHLLKKYDLASDEEQEERDRRLLLVLKNV